MPVQMQLILALRVRADVVTQAGLPAVSMMLSLCLAAGCICCAPCSGHQSFSNNRSLNDLVGNIVHSSIMVPYHGERQVALSGSDSGTPCRGL